MVTGSSIYRHIVQLLACQFELTHTLKMSTDTLNMLTPGSPYILFPLKEVKCCLNFEDSLTPKRGLDTCTVSLNGDPFIKRLRYCEQKQQTPDSATKRIQEICKISLRNESITKYAQNFEENQEVKPLECPVCGQTYSDSKNLKQHRRVHYSKQFLRSLTVIS